MIHARNQPRTPTFLFLLPCSSNTASYAFRLLLLLDFFRLLWFYRVLRRALWIVHNRRSDASPNSVCWPLFASFHRKLQVAILYMKLIFMIYVRLVIVRSLKFHHFPFTTAFSAFSILVVFRHFLPPSPASCTPRQGGNHRPTRTKPFHNGNWKYFTSARLPMYIAYKVIINWNGKDRRNGRLIAWNAGWP